MPIELVTGLPGAGKSLGMVERMLSFRERDASRPVFALGVDGLKDGLAQAITPDDLQHWYDYPTGSIFLVDEAQKYFPMRRAGDPPAWIRKLSEHRHLGHDFVLATQAPGYLDNYVRGLIDRHVHLVRKFGAHVADWYEWPAVSMSPLTSTERKRATHRLWRYPKKCFDLYHSAELHTVKRRIPKKLILLLVAPVMLVAAVLVVPRVMKRGEKVGPQANSQNSTAGLLAPAAISGGGERQKWATPEDYVKAFIPRVANQPWSAPAYDGNGVKSKPDLICIEYEVKGDMLCGCYTEQVTPYELHNLAECRRYARHGVYNPQRAPLEDRERRVDGSGQGQTAQAGVSATPVSVHGSTDAWQPEWRTRAYVQPERTEASPIVGATNSGG